MLAPLPLPPGVLAQPPRGNPGSATDTEIQNKFNKHRIFLESHAHVIHVFKGRERDDHFNPFSYGF